MGGRAVAAAAVLGALVGASVALTASDGLVLLQGVVERPRVHVYRNLLFAGCEGLVRIDGPGIDDPPPRDTRVEMDHLVRLCPEDGWRAMTPAEERLFDRVMEARRAEPDG